MKTVHVCTIHFKVLDRGVWKTSLWSETMAQRHSLVLKEGVCSSCMAEARQVLAWQMRLHWEPASNSPLTNTSLSA